MGERTLTAEALSGLVGGLAWPLPKGILYWLMLRHSYITIDAMAQQFHIWPLGSGEPELKGKKVELPFPVSGAVLYVVQPPDKSLWFQMRDSALAWGKKKLSHRYGRPLSANALLHSLEAGLNVLVEHLPAANLFRMVEEYAPKFIGSEFEVHKEPYLTYPAFGFGLNHVAWYTNDDDHVRAQTLRLPTHEHPYFGGIYMTGSFDEAQVRVAIDYLTEEGFSGKLPLLERIVVH